MACAVLLPSGAFAGLGDCGQPKSGGSQPSASDALEVLRTAVGQSDCGGLDPCICDVNASGEVLAGDALRVLKRAVGQDVTLDCTCSVTTTTTATTTTTTEAVLTTQVVVLTRSEGTYSTSDMAGTWDGAALASGPAAPLWGRFLLNVQSNGSFSGTVVESNGLDEDVSGKLSVSSAGVVTCTQNCTAMFRGAMDSGKSVVVITDTLDGDSSELIVVTRRGSSYVQADMAGAWALGSLRSGPGAPWASRGSFLVEADGSFEADIVATDGASGAISGTLSLQSDARVTCASSGCAANFVARLDGGETLAAGTQTVAGGSTDLVLMSKQAVSYSPSDLTGTWYLGSLASGLDEPYWSRGTVTIAADGTMSGTLAEMDGGSAPVGGKLVISGDGIVTKTGDPDVRCSLDAGKTVIVCTGTGLW